VPRKIFPTQIIKRIKNNPPLFFNDYCGIITIPASELSLPQIRVSVGCRLIPVKSSQSVSDHHPDLFQHPLPLIRNLRCEGIFISPQAGEGEQGRSYAGRFNAPSKTSVNVRLNEPAGGSNNSIKMEDAMKAMRIILTTLSVLLATVAGAFAATTAKVYSSGILVIVFLSFCALVVVIQLIPAIAVLFGIIKGLVKNAEDANMDEVKTEK